MTTRRSPRRAPDACDVDRVDVRVVDERPEEPVDDLPADDRVPADRPVVAFAAAPFVGRALEPRAPLDVALGAAFRVDDGDAFVVGFVVGLGAGFDVDLGAAFEVPLPEPAAEPRAVVDRDGPDVARLLDVVPRGVSPDRRGVAPERPEDPEPPVRPPPERAPSPREVPAPRRPSSARTTGHSSVSNRTAAPPYDVRVHRPRSRAAATPELSESRRAGA
ncbi:hypothetical protein [Isoptericola sp. NPDC057191]|uniref:hypothetical protein n=1 Tax=Isoptericola sp. NPDC057191 TaxID=3346041 RepID=UPI003627140D